MPLRWRAGLAAIGHDRRQHITWIPYIFVLLWVSLGYAMSPADIAELRKETVRMFYHGYDNYMNVAFPEDEVST